MSPYERRSRCSSLCNALGAASESGSHRPARVKTPGKVDATSVSEAQRDFAKVLVREASLVREYALRRGQLDRKPLAPRCGTFAATRRQCPDFIPSIDCHIYERSSVRTIYIAVSRFRAVLKYRTKIMVILLLRPETCFALLRSLRYRRSAQTLLKQICFTLSNVL